MAEGVPVVEGSSDALRLKACPGCGYSLEALPAEGVCPECGRAYDQRYVVLVGQGRGWWDGAAGGTWRGLVWQGVAMGVLLWVFAAGPGALRSPILLVCGGAAVLSLVVQLYARLFSAVEPQMQLWVSAEGVGQVASTPEARRAQWLTWVTGLLWFPFYAGAMLLEDGRQLGGVGLGIFALVLAVIAAVVMVVEGRGSRYRRGRVAEDCRPVLSEWGRIEGVEVRVLAGGRVRVRCETTRTWGPVKVRKEWPVDIEVGCSEGEAAALRERMEGWWRAAGGGK